MKKHKKSYCRCLCVILCALLFVPLLAAVPVFAADNGYRFVGTTLAASGNSFVYSYSFDTALSGTGSTRGYSYRWTICSSSSYDPVLIPVDDLSNLSISLSCVFQGDLTFSEASVSGALARTRSVLYSIGCFDSSSNFIKYVKFRDVDFSLYDHFINILGAELPSNTSFITVTLGVGYFISDHFNDPNLKGTSDYATLLSPGVSFLGSVSLNNGDHSFTSGLYSSSGIKPVQYVWTHNMQDIYLGNSTSFNTCLGIYNTYHEVSNVSFEMFSDSEFDEEYSSYYSDTADFTFNVFRVSALALVNTGQSVFCNVRIKVNGITVWTGSGATVNLGTASDDSGGSSGGSSEDILEILDDTKEIKDALDLVQLQNEQLQVSMDEVKDTLNATDPALNDAVGKFDEGSAEVDSFEQQQWQDFEENSHVVTDQFQIFSDTGTMVGAFMLVSGIVQKTFNALGPWQPVLTVPIAVGIVVFIWSRVPSKMNPNKHRDDKPRDPTD